MSVIHALGYIVVQGPVDEWREFGTTVLGAQVGAGSTDEVLRLRTDDRAYRILVEDGPAAKSETLVALGFETTHAAALDELVAILGSHGVAVEDDAELAKHRQVRRLVRFQDPDGNTLEAYYGQASDHHGFVSPRGLKFVTGDLGVGHAFLLSRDADAQSAFYRDVLGFRLSDTIDFGMAEGIFMHCNSRHHSVAFATVPAPPGIGHLMLEVTELEAVGRALDVVQKDPKKLTMAMGEHTNDRMTSFYVETPSGFDIEYGWNGLLITDEDEWTVGHYESMSTWGHQMHPLAPKPEQSPSTEPAV